MCIRHIWNQIGQIKWSFYQKCLGLLNRLLYQVFFILLQGMVFNIISDSIVKDVVGIWQANIIPFPGIDIARLSARIERSPSLVSKPFTLIHVGTNIITTRNQSELIILS